MASAMTRPHFEAIAHAIATSFGLSSVERQHVAERIADEISPFNSRFSRDRFIEAATRDIYGERSDEERKAYLGEKYGLCTCDDYPGQGKVIIHSHTCPLKGK